MQRIIESPISKSAQVDWEKEIKYALEEKLIVLERNGYSVPFNIYGTVFTVNREQ